MNALVLLATARALADRVVGRRIRRAGLVNEREFGLVLAGLSEPGMLVLAAEPGAPHVRFERSRTPSRRLTDQLGPAPALLKGATITHVGLVGGERILHFALAAHPGDKSGDDSTAPAATPAAPLALYFEMLPRSPFIIVTAGGAIVLAMRPPGTHRADERRMARGGPYLLPFDLGPPAALPDLGAALAARLATAAPASGSRAAVASELLRGVPRDVLERLLAGAEDTAAAVDRLTGYRGPLAIGASGAGDPELRAEVAAPGDPSPDPLAVLAVLAAWALERRERAGASALRAAATRALKKAGAKAARARAALAEDRAKLGDPADLRRRGSALLASLAQVPRGAAAVTVPDPGATGPPLVIALDPKRPPAANAEAYFQSARRAERARSQLSTREQEIAVIEEKIASAAERIALAVDQELAALAAELARAGLIPPELAAPPAGAGKPARAAPVARLPYRTYALGGGWEIRVGRSDADNDVLTHELAHPRDLWLHAHGAAGSHVILRRQDGTHGVPPAAIVLEAAAAAAHWSTARHSRLVPVIVTEKRYVRRPRRSLPGTAACLREKTVMVEPRKPAAAAAEAAPPDAPESPRRSGKAHGHSPGGGVGARGGRGGEAAAIRTRRDPRRRT